MIVSIGVIVFDTDPALLKACITSVLRQEIDKSFELELLVRDNSSNQHLADTFSDLATYWIAAPNEGFGSAANDLVRRANGEYFLLLNPDAELDVGALAQMLDAINNLADESSCLFCGWLVDAAGRVQVDAYLHWWSSTGRLIRRSMYRKYLQSVSSSRSASVQKISGAATFAATRTLKELGPYDERFFLYGEDADLSQRAALAGYSLTVLPFARVMHKASSSVQTHSALVERARVDAALRLNAYHVPFAVALMLRLELALITTLGMIASRRTSSSSWRVRGERIQILRAWGLKRDMPKFAPAKPHYDLMSDLG